MDGGSQQLQPRPLPCYAPPTHLIGDLLILRIPCRDALRPHSKQAFESDGTGGEGRGGEGTSATTSHTSRHVRTATEPQHGHARAHAHTPRRYGCSIKTASRAAVAARQDPLHATAAHVLGARGRRGPVRGGGGGSTYLPRSMCFLVVKKRTSSTFPCLWLSEAIAAGTAVLLGQTYAHMMGDLARPRPLAMARILLSLRIS